MKTDDIDLRSSKKLRLLININPNKASDKNLKARKMYLNGLLSRKCQFYIEAWDIYKIDLVLYDIFALYQCSCDKWNFEQKYRIDRHHSWMQMKNLNISEKYAGTVQGTKSFSNLFSYGSKIWVSLDTWA